MERKDWYIFKNKDFKTKKEYKGSFGRPIADDEIVIEFDYPCPDYTLAYLSLLENLQAAGYNAEVWDADGMKCPHIHIKNITGLSLLPPDIRRKYKEEFINKYVPLQFIEYVDLGLCGKHNIAEEGVPHFKYGTIKKGQAGVNGRNINSVERHLVKRSGIAVMKQKFTKKWKEKYQGPWRSIVEIAEKAGIEVDKNGRALCPFHADSIPSLYFSDTKGLFHCFGCGVGGGINKFKELLDEKEKTN